MHRLRLVDWSKISYVLKGILVGIVAGIIISLFRMSIEIILVRMPDVYEFLREHPVWIIGWALILLVTALLIILLVRDEPDIKGNGLAEIKGHLAGVLQLRWFSVLWRKFIGSTLVLGLGIPVGREGPALQIGGVTGQGVNHFLKGNKSQENILISSGVAAGLSAAFNAPLSGLVLTLEEVHHRFSSILILAVFSSSVTANFIAYQLFGTTPAIALDPVGGFPLEQYIFLIFFGILLAFAGWLFQKAVFAMPGLYAKLPIPPYLLMLIPFILLIPTGLFWEEMLGGGTGIVSAIATNRTATSVLAAILLFRVIGFVLAYGSGIPAGMLVPMLAIGGILGGIFGNSVLNITGIEDAYIQSFVVYGMGGFFTVVSKAPLTAIVLITELTGSVTQMMPISIVCLTAYVFADLIGIEPADDLTLRNKTNSIPKVFEGKLAHLDIFIEPNGQLDGVTMGDLTLPYNAKITRIKRHDNEFMPHQDTVFLTGDEVKITCDQGFVAEVQKYIKKLN